MFKLLKKTNHRTKIYSGIFFALLAAILVGTTNIVGKILVSAEHSDATLHPLNVVLITSIIVGLMFTNTASKKEPIKNIRKRIFSLIVLMGILDTSAIVIGFSGLQHTSAINASILGDTEIMFGILIAVAIFREKITKKEFLPLIILMTGSMLIPIGFDLYQNNLSFSASSLGGILIISSALLYAIDIGISRYVTRGASSERISQIAAFAGFPFALILVIIFQIPFHVTLDHIPYILYFGIFIVGLSYYFFLIALRLIGIIKTIVIYSSASTFGIFFSNVFLGESITEFNILSVGLIIVGVYLLRDVLMRIDS